MKQTIAVIGTAFLWALLGSGILFALAFVWPLLIGGKGSHQGPLMAFAIAPAAFLLIFFVALVLQIRRAAALPTSGQIVCGGCLLVLVGPAVAVALGGVKVAQEYVSWTASRQSFNERMAGAPALSPDERAMVERSAPLDLKVAVEPGSYTPVHAKGLANDLRAAGVFAQVAPVEQIDAPDLIAIVTGNPFGDRAGAVFRLNRAATAGAGVDVKVTYYVGGLLSTAERTQYLDRLGVESLRAVQGLSEEEEES